MKLLLTAIANRSPDKSFAVLSDLYQSRIAAYSAVESLFFRSEKNFFDWVDKQRSRVIPLSVFLDSRGMLFSSAQFADWLGKQRDQGQQAIVFAIGPADGWSEEARKRANLLLSLGPMTLPHELARVVLSEQIYRAFTILSGHPYHTGH
jgi:23S rRNA (pseudouridine1915-N3)-methyltransferase